MNLSHVFLGGSLFFRVVQLVIFAFVMRYAWIESQIRDRIIFLRYMIFAMLLIYVSALFLMLYTTYCRFDHCFNQMVLDGSNLYSSVAGVAIAICMLVLYHRKYEDD